MSLVAVSKHLKVLEAAGLVQRTVDGRVHRCALQAQPMHDLEQWLEHYRAYWDGTLDALASYLEAEVPNDPTGEQEP
jgi:DNA-binding transcriptional ArsR family regulator